MPRHSRSALLAVTCTIASSILIAQRGPAPDPLVRENATVKLGPHTYVIPDNNVGLVPNVGIIVGSHATLVIDPGLGRRNGETVLREVAKVSKNSELFIGTTHFMRSTRPVHRISSVSQVPSTPRYRRPSSSRVACRWSRCSPDDRPRRPKS